MAATAGESFTNAYRGTVSAGNERANQINKYQRTLMAPHQFNLQMQRARANIGQQRLALQQRMQQLQMSQQRLDLQERTLNTRMQEANNRLATTYGGTPTPVTGGGIGGGPNMAGAGGAVGGAAATPGQGNYQFDNAGLTQAQQIQMIYKDGAPYQMQTSGGDLGTYVFPTSSQRTSLQGVQNAMPQLASSMNEIARGAQYYANAPDKLKKYFASCAAYYTGKATPAQDKILTDAGVSLNGITQAGETAMRVMGLAKTNESLHQTLSLFMPKKGSGTNAYFEQQRSVFDDLKRRALQASYTATMGQPQDLAASQDMNNYINQGMKNNFFNSIYEPSENGSTMPQLRAPRPNQVGFLGNASIVSQPTKAAPVIPSLQNKTAAAPNPADVDAENIKMIMQKYPNLSQAQAEQVYKNYQAKKGAA